MIGRLLETMRSNDEAGDALPKFDGPLDDLIYAISNSRRRLVIRHLTVVPETTKRDLSEKVAEEEGCKRNSAYTALHQNHIEVLDGVGIIVTDQNKDMVARGPNFEAASCALEDIEGYV